MCIFLVKLFHVLIVSKDIPAIGFIPSTQAGTNDEYCNIILHVRLNMNKG
jgi:hypothetical protein